VQPSPHYDVIRQAIAAACDKDRVPHPLIPRRAGAVAAALQEE
jgi:hypothetical protein